MTATNQTAQVAADSPAAEPVVAAAEITVDGVRLPPEFEVEVGEVVWLIRSGQRVRRLPPSSRITVDGDDWTAEFDGAGKGVYRGHAPRPDA